MPIDPSHNNSIHRVHTGHNTDSTTSARRAEASHAEPAATGSSTRLHRFDTSDTRHDIDTARVAEIRQGIADGTLTFDTSRIADGIIASARELAEDQ